MTPPVIYHMFLNLMAYVCIGEGVITTVSLKEPISDHFFGVTPVEVFHAKAKNAKSISFQPRDFKKDSNLMLSTRSGKIYSFVLKKCESPHTTILIKDGTRDTSFSMAMRQDSFSIETGKNSHIVKSHKNNLKINGKMYLKNKSIVIPKGSPIFVNNKRVLN
jgi:hypothetical protein